MKTLVNIIHTYNILFLLCLNILEFKFRIPLVILYVYFYMHSLNLRYYKLEANSKKTILIVALVLFLFTYSYLLNGYNTIPNWDYYKYNKLLLDIFNGTLMPSLELDGATFPLAYYYAIFLPTVAVAHIISIIKEISVFDLQFLFISINTSIVVFLLYLINYKIRKYSNTNIFLWIILFVGGLDYLFLLSFEDINQGSLLINDIQNGGKGWFFRPLRLQDFLSYLFWLPGHLISSLVALYFIIHIENETINKDLKKVILVPLVLFLFSTSIFSFFGFFIFMTYFYLVKKEVNLLNFINFQTIIVISLMIVFYTFDRHKSGLGMFLSLHIFSYELKTYILFIVQEFFIFLLLGLISKQDKAYYLAILSLILFSLFGSRDLLMSTGILMILYLLYSIAKNINYVKTGGGGQGRYCLLC